MQQACASPEPPFSYYAGSACRGVSFISILFIVYGQERFGNLTIPVVNIEPSI